MKPLVRLGLPLVVTVGLLVAVGRAIDGPQFGARLLDVQPLGVVVASAAVPLQVALAARRWQAANATNAPIIRSARKFITLCLWSCRGAVFGDRTNC
ncbi:MAG: hypothetical protein AAF602_33350 [Myxococcota bacterium]